MMDKRNKGKKRFCGHCEQEVSRRTFYKHKRLFYDNNAKKWSDKRVYYDDPSAHDVRIAPQDSNSFLPGGDPSMGEIELDMPDVYNSFHDEDPEMEETEDGESLDKSESHSSSDDDNQPEVWDDDPFDSEMTPKDSSIAISTPNIQRQVEVNSDKYKPLIRLYAFFLLMFQTLFRLSDKALSILLAFFSMFMGSLTKSFPSVSFKAFVQLLPSGVAAIHKAVGGDRDDFEKYVCCPSCHSIYPLSDIYSQDSDGKTKMVQKKCSYVRYPDHPQSQHRKPCGTPLMKLVKVKGTERYSPRLLYCYRSLIKSLQEKLKQHNFLEKCEAWRKRKLEEGVYSDVFDGKVWNDFLNPEGVPFLSLPYNFALQLNVDWFNPYERTMHSEGAMYISIMNLPRSERFLQENIVLVGMIPGPKEPSLHINSFLQPLVDDLLKLWEGVVLKNSCNRSVLVRAALLCSACDIPASRKVCGFVGHNATKGCNRCLLSFPCESFGDKCDYSNFDRSQWLPRTNKSNREAAEKHRKCNTQTKQRELEQEFGVRYTVLNKLPYFDASRMTIIDPMHNLLLGTSKHMVDVWKSCSLLDSNKDMVTIQNKVNSFFTPPDIGRTPTKISSGFSGFTAEQWKNWTVYFSLYTLKDLLPWQHYNCWHLFVKLCYLLCRRKITQTQLQEADKFIKEFCASFVTLYGPSSCTMNMHLHGHLVSCIEDYGPVYAFWCFAYERLNGVLGTYHTNHHNISAQLMRRFLDSKTYSPNKWPEEFVADFLPLLEKFRYHKGSLMQSTLETQLDFGDVHIQPLPPMQEYTLSAEEISQVEPHFQAAFDQPYRVLVLSQKVKAVKVSDYVISGHSSRHSGSPFVLAKRNCSFDLAEIEYFIECIAVSKTCPKNNPVHLWIAVVKWFMEHPCKVWYGYPLQVWTTTVSPGFSLIPVAHIQCRVAYVKCTRDFGRMLSNDTVYVIVPLSA